MQKRLKNSAKLLRKNSTAAERYLWKMLRDRQLCRYKFRRQYVIEPYIVDFVCVWRKLIVELDGGQHADQVFYDSRRTLFLNAKGFKVLRFWNMAVYQDRESVVETILAALEGKHCD